ncbi:programmed cell death protein 2-like isoform X2 [Hydra vulgaris]|uniref:Programmed cell death protein 2-like isoform X2 n=1 Tax=Hydra vulgaris TaxID=6087 RepID=A0ABM4BT58_HYDVU
MSTLIGFQDDEIIESVDWSCNKFGGLPDWMIPGTQLPSCELCGDYMWQVAQIYCPLLDSNYHRTLNTFVCIKKECLKKHGSATVYRSQMAEVTSNASKVNLNQDDWGTNDWVSDPFSQDNISNEETGTADSQTSKLECIETKQNTKDSLDISCFRPYYVFVLNESEVSYTDNSSYEQRMFEEYVVKEFNQVSLNNTEGQSEIYEKTQVKHGDHAFHRFKKIISNSPTQCMRYKRNGEPLILSSISTPTASFENVPPCSYCANNRVFEMQFMPHITTCLVEMKKIINKNNMEAINLNTESFLLSKTNPKENKQVCLDFGCLYVFTCSISCWKDGDCAKSEYVIIQPDPDETILSDMLKIQ